MPVRVPDEDAVHDHQHERADESAGQRVVVADDRVLHGVRQEQQHDEIERVELAEFAFAEQAQAANEKSINGDRPDDFLPERNSGDHHVVPDRIHCVHSAAGEAAQISPRHSPNPIRAAPSRSHQPRKITSSPSSRNARRSPDGSDSGSAPRQVSSSRQPRESFSGPDTVPLASKSPGRRLHPLLEWCVTSWATVQYIDSNEPDDSAHGRLARRAHRGRTEPHLERDAEPAARLICGRAEIRQRRGIAGRRANAGVRNGSSASSVTTHGATVVAKLFARKGPSGWYSQLCMSRADQSFTRHSPKRRSSARPIGTVSPTAFSPHTNAPISSS